MTQQGLEPAPDAPTPETWVPSARERERDGVRRALRRRGLTHEMAFAREVASSVCFLDGGRILEQGPPEQIFGDPGEERTRQNLRRVLPPAL